MSSRADVVQGSPPARDLEPGSGVGPALDPGEPLPYPWPPHDYLELGALPTAVACARLHARNMLWEWGLDWLASDAELLVAELMTSAVTTAAARDAAPVRLRLSSDGTRILIEVWDADPWPPDPKKGRGLSLVTALSARWNWYKTKGPNGKVVWCELETLTPRGGQTDVSARAARSCKGKEGFLQAAFGYGQVGDGIPEVVQGPDGGVRVGSNEGDTVSVGVDRGYARELAEAIGRPGERPEPDGSRDPGVGLDLVR